MSTLAGMVYGATKTVVRNRLTKRKYVLESFKEKEPTARHIVYVRNESLRYGLLRQSPTTCQSLRGRPPRFQILSIGVPSATRPRLAFMNRWEWINGNRCMNPWESMNESTWIDVCRLWLDRHAFFWSDILFYCFTVLRFHKRAFTFIHTNESLWIDEWIDVNRWEWINGNRCMNPWESMNESMWINEWINVNRWMNRRESTYVGLG